MSWNEKYDMEEREVWLYKVIFAVVIGIALLIPIGVVAQVVIYYLQFSCI